MLRSGILALASGDKNIIEVCRNGLVGRAQRDLDQDADGNESGVLGDM
jgi:hypothetical protein